MTFSRHVKLNSNIRPLSRCRDEVIQRVTTLLNEEIIEFEGWFRDMRRWVERGSARHLFE